MKDLEEGLGLLNIKTFKRSYLHVWWRCNEAELEFDGDWGILINKIGLAKTLNWATKMEKHILRLNVTKWLSITG